MKKNILIILLLILSQGSAASTQSPPFHLCFFSLNNEKEFHVSSDLMSKASAFSEEPKVKVTEYMREDHKPEKDFKKMVEKKASCDGLVISGHHTGSFGGKRSDGSLSLDFLEDLSCQEEHQDWFVSLKSVWLQGCRTLGSDEILPHENLADFHTRRVGSELEADGLEQSLEELNNEFSATLDDSNPISDRYRRLFPSAKVFGWTETAPGVQAQSEYSLVFHIAQLMSLNNEGEFPVNLLKQSYRQEEVSYFDNPFRQLFELKDKKSVLFTRKAWRAHGQGGEFAFLNSDLNSYPPLFFQEEKPLRKIHQTGCVLRKGQKESVFKVLDEVLVSEEVLGYHFNSIERLLKRKDVNFQEELIRKLKEGDVFHSFLRRRLSSSRVGMLRKIGFLFLWKKLYSSEYLEFRKEREEEIYGSIKRLFKGLGYEGLRSYDLRDYKLSVLNHLLKYEFEEAKFLEVLKLALDDKNESVRNEAVIVAGKLGGERAWPVIEKAIDDENWTVRREAVRVAGKLGGERAWPFVEKAMNDKIWNVRWHAVKAAGKLGGQRAWPVIEKAMDDKDKSVRWQAVIAAGKLGGENAWPIIEKAMNDENEYVREEAVEAAGELGGKNAWLVIEKAMNDENEYVREEAVIVAGKLGGERAWIFIERVMDDESWIVRQKAVIAAGKLGGQKAWPFVEKAMNDKIWNVRAYAVYAAGKLGGENAWPVIEKAMNDKIWNVRWQAVRVAGKLGGQRAWPVIEKAMDDKDRSVRQEAVKAAGKLGGQRAWPFVEKAMNDKIWNVRWQAVRVAGKLGGQRAWPVIEKAMDDKDRSVRQEAVKAAEKLRE